jgi:antitoxin MazE
MKTAIRRMGNSQGILIPKPVLAEIGVSTNDAVELKVKKGRIVIAPLARKVRVGWADDAKGLREAGETGLVWGDAARPAKSTK